MPPNGSTANSDHTAMAIRKGGTAGLQKNFWLEILEGGEKILCLQNLAGGGNVLDLGNCYKASLNRSTSGSLKGAR
jgi:hypothetical protein